MLKSFNLKLPHFRVPEFLLQATERKTKKGKEKGKRKRKRFPRRGIKL